MNRSLILILSGICIMAGCKQQTKYPQAPKDDTVDNYFGVEVADPFRPLEDDHSDVTAAWVKAENKVTDSYLSKIPFRDKIRKRLTELADYEKVGMPSKHGDKFYFSRNSGLQNQSVIYVLDAPAEGQNLDLSTAKVFLDPNKLSDDGTVALKSLSFSNDGKWAAYVVSRNGSDWQEIYVIDLATGENTEDHIEWAKFSGATWHGDGFYYSAYDRPEGGHDYSDINEGMKIYYHKLGTPQSEDTLFYENKEHPKRFYSVEVNHEETIAYLYEDGEGNGNNLYIKDLRRKGSDFRLISPDDMENRYYPVADFDGKIIIYTNREAPNNKLMEADLVAPNYSNWYTLVEEKDEVLSSAQPAGDKLILVYSKDASDHAYVYNKLGWEEKEVTLPSVGSVGFSSDKDEPYCYYSFTSFTVPSSIYSYNLESGESTLFKEPKTAFDQDNFTNEQIFFQSKDGTRIPMFLTYKKGMELNGNNPVLIYGYGGFDISLPPSFSTMRIPFLENGGIYVQVTLRGGGEYGEEWHLAGTKMQKQNVFDDFIGAAEYLISQNYTNKDKIAIMGGSNGGLLVGACMTQRPDLFKVAIPQVGVMDMLRYHKFTIGWNWASDYGTSDDSKEMFEYLYAYSPLHNIKPGVSYPATLVTTADHDDRVVPAHSFKFAATLQECNAGPNPVLIRIDSNAGHGGGKPMSKSIDEYTDIYSFILYNLGVDVTYP